MRHHQGFEGVPRGTLAWSLFSGLFTAPGADCYRNIQDFKFENRGDGEIWEKFYPVAWRCEEAVWNA